MKKIGIILLLAVFPLNLFSQQVPVFALQNQVSSRISIDTTINNNTLLFPFNSKNTISGLAFSGEISLLSDSSLVRIILMDNHYNEYLICEAYPVLSGSEQFSVHEAAEETSQLNNITPEQVSFEIINASIHINEFIISEEESIPAQTKSSRMLELTLNKIERINQNIQKAGQTWIAGETSISKLSYQEKKSMFGGRVPNFQGFEYYVGGVFVLPGVKDNVPNTKGTPSENLSQQESQYPDEFSWQDRHGINWVTPVKHQGSCKTCTAFGTAAAAELLVNLYFNRLLNYDLSEQNIVSCNGSCEYGVLTNITLNYMKNTGIVLEDCFPYTVSDSYCSEICSDPSERIKIENWETANPNEEDTKRGIIQGATAGKITSWNHVAQFVGYKTIEPGDILYIKDANDSIFGISIEEDNPLTGKTAWLIKNSWGTSWGTDGFGNVVGNGGDIILYTLHGPVSSLVLNEEDISCTDNDGDGFYCWGIGPKPSHCPECPDQADGDDSNPCFGPMDEFGNLIYLTPTPETKDTIILFGNDPDLYVEGSNVRWYQDKTLQDLVSTGNLFHTGQTEPGKYTYYVTQTLSGCESAADDISLSLVTEIPPPIGKDMVIDEGELAVLHVEGEQGAVFKWYEDPLLTDLLDTGDYYDTGKQDTGVYTYYVTQTLCLIESAPDTVSLKIIDLVTIPDTAFLYALIREGVDRDGDNVISPFEAEAVESLNVNQSDITDITGIEAFVNLDSLFCSYNSIDTINISGLFKLVTFNCRGNELYSLDVSNNTALTRLVCWGNQLTSLDVSSNTALTRLQCGWNQLTSLDVSKNSALTILECSGNPLTSLDVSNNAALQNLGCVENQLTSLDVSNNTALTRLDCGGNKLTNLDVSNNTALEFLNCGFEKWGCYSNQLTSLDVSNNTALTRLDCGGNKLTNLDVSNNIALHDLSCSSNQLTSLDVSNNTALKYLYCYENELTSLDVSINTALEYLNCGNNQLTSLDVSGCSALTELNCERNELTSLDVSNCIALGNLFCGNNQLTSLDVSNNTALKYLYCYENELTSLDVSANKALGGLSCSSNQLTYLNLCDNSDIMNLGLEDMPSLDSVFVWSLFPSGVSVYKSGSPNVEFIDCSVGIEGCTQSELLIYPNPTNELLTIETEYPDHYSIEITSLNGQQILISEMEGTSHQVDLSAFQKGIYLITVRSKDFIETRKLIKIHQDQR